MANNPAAFQAILAQISANIAPASIDLTDYGLTDNDVNQLVAALKINTSVTDLQLHGNSAITAIGWQAMTSLLGANTPLSVLTLDSCGVDDADFSILLNGLGNNNRLTILSLGGNNLSATSANSLINLIPNTAINGINLAYSFIGDTAAIALASLPNLTSILNLEGCQLSAAAMTKIFQLLATNNLESLFIGNNQYSLASMQQLADVLSSGTALQQLSLLGVDNPNGSNDLFVEPLIPVLHKAQNLAWLSLANSGLSETITAQFTYFLQSGTNLRTFDIQTGNDNSQNAGIINAIITRNQAYPQLFLARIAVGQGLMVTLTPPMIGGTSPRSAPLSFNVKEVKYGVFINSDSGQVVTQFSQDDLTAGRIQLIHDGSYIPPYFEIQATDGTFSTNYQPSLINFVPYTGNFTLVNNNITVSPGMRMALNSNNLLCLLKPTQTAIIPSGLIFKVANIQGGKFCYRGSDTAISAFPQAAIILGQIDFVCANSTIAPQIQLQVSDGNRTSTAITINTQFVPVSSSSATTASQPLTTITPPLVTTPQLPTSVLTARPTAIGSAQGRGVSNTSSTAGIALGAAALGGLFVLAVLVATYFLWRWRNRNRNLGQRRGRHNIGHAPAGAIALPADVSQPVYVNAGGVSAAGPQIAFGNPIYDEQQMMMHTMQLNAMLDLTDMLERLRRQAAFARRLERSPSPAASASSAASTAVPVPAELPEEFQNVAFDYELMRNPVVAADGFSYERANIEEWFRRQRDQGYPYTSPMDGRVISNLTLIPNANLRRLIRRWREENDPDGTLYGTVGEQAV